jgi:hypothetical protein
MSARQVKDLTPRLITTNSLEKQSVDVNSVHIGFGNSNIASIAKEWDINRSNAKDTTIMNGVREAADRDIALQIKGHQFMIDRSGRQMAPFLGHFTSKLRELASAIVVDGGSEHIYDENQMLESDVVEAVRYKILLKKILLYSRITFCNHQDGNLITFEVTGEETGEPLVQAVFQGGAEEQDLYLSLTETTNFSLEETLAS